MTCQVKITYDYILSKESEKRMVENINQPEYRIKKCSITNKKIFK